MTDHAYQRIDLAAVEQQRKQEALRQLHQDAGEARTAAPAGAAQTAAAAGPSAAAQPGAAPAKVAVALAVAEPLAAAPAADPAAEPTPGGKLPTAIRWFVVPLAIALCIAQAVLTVLGTNRAGGGVYFTSTLITVLAFGALFGLVALVNPLMRLLPIIRPFNRPELICVFAAMMVTAGISTFGLADQLVPLVAAPFNPEWNTPQRGWNERLTPNLNKSLYITDTDAILVFREGIKKSADGATLVAPSATSTFGERMVYYRQIFQAIPWKIWIKPLSGWLIFIAACYSMFFFLSRVVLGNWSQREKLIFPLARLPESLLPEPGSKSWFPPILRSWGFWAGFALSFLVLSYNGAIAARWITGLTRLNLGMSGYTVNALVTGTVFEGLQYTTMFLIIFTAIGIAFLLPLEISFSIWFYFVLSRVMLLLATWFGMGKNGRDFPSDWLWATNFVTSQGAGGLLLFSAVSLYRAIKSYVVLARGKSIEQRITIALPVVGLALSLLVMVLWFRWNNLGLLWGGVLALFLTLMTLGLMRVVAEGGLYWFQNFGGSVFHFYKVMGLGKIASLSPLIVGPLLPIYSVLFLDIKTFLAPNLLNAEKMYEDVAASRRRFYLTVILAMAASVVVSLGLAIYLSYLKGAQQMNSWFYSAGPAWILDLSNSATSAHAKFDPASAAWYLLGAIWVGLTMFLRRTLFWFPHPIGYAMLISPLMEQVWFSFFIGWICKKLVIKYGGKATFDKTRVIFIGLIMGELMAVCLYPLCSMLFGFHVSGIDLNRYGP